MDPLTLVADNRNQPHFLEGCDRSACAHSPDVRDLNQGASLLCRHNQIY